MKIDTENSLVKKPEVAYKSELVVKSFEEEKANIEVLIKSSALPKDCSTPEQVYMKWQYGSELGMKKMEALHYLTLISGTQTVNAKGVGFLCKANRLTFKIVKNFEYIYAFDGKEIRAPRKLTPNEAVYGLGLTRDDYNALDKIKQDLIVVARDIEMSMDYGWIEDINKPWLVKWENNPYSFFWSDLPKDLQEKDTYTKYPKRMMIHRCKTAIASMLGILTAPESHEFAMANKIEDIEFEVME